MSRIRFAFEKRKFFCFVRHVELPQLFGRVARRAGLHVELTQGMSPHPHIVMGAALPVGVVSLRELAEIWFTDSLPPQEIMERLNACVPSGLKFLAAREVDGPSLNKQFNAASYWLCPRDMPRLGEAKDVLSEALGSEVILDAKMCSDGLELVMSDPSQTGPGALVKALTERGVISGWSDVCIARLALGTWRADLRAVEPLL
ncbi:MAG: TIGR03936 family radical SAM-associated protein [Pyramidobacter sp.]|nr:TIGR03936 family radical SAM-associated protein [Pyramidobacter sp.]